jgi:hypothetical protein
MGFEQQGEKVDDIEQARVGAHAEKPVRDLAREKGVSEEEKAILDRLAEKHGEKAIQEYAAEREKNPIERLRGRIDKIAAEMREKGLESDAAIVEKMKDRFDRYAETLRKRKESMEQKSGKRVTAWDVRRETYSIQDTGIATEIPVTHQIGDKGGAVYGPDGFIKFVFDGTADTEIQERDINRVRELEQKGGELINFGFSKQGEAEFYRVLGVLGEKEEVIDIPTVYEKRVREAMEKKTPGRKIEVTIDPKKYKLGFDTNIKGVGISIEKNDSVDSYGGKRVNEERITLNFDESLSGEILAEK